MNFIVTMDIFSGRENPRFVLDEEMSKKLLPLIETDADKLLSNVQPDVLGYRGFEVSMIEAPERAVPSLFLAPAGPRGIHVYNSVPAEEFLMKAAEAAGIAGDILEFAIADQSRVFARPELLFPPDIDKEKDPGCPVCMAADAPAYNPGFWNIPSRQPYNNCYNYANNQATNTFAQPGRATGNPITALTCPGVQPSAQSDGLNPVGGFSGKLTAGQGWYVALVVAPGYDYHWYRQDDVGCWSHKPGQTTARNTDNSGNPITDPKTCDRGPYTDFCSYMVTGSWVKIS